MCVSQFLLGNNIHLLFRVSQCSQRHKRHAFFCCCLSLINGELHCLHVMVSSTPLLKNKYVHAIRFHNFLDKDNFCISASAHHHSGLLKWSAVHELYKQVLICIIFAALFYFWWCRTLENSCIKYDYLFRNYRHFLTN